MFNSLGTWFRRQSVARKLTTTALITSGVTLMAACTVFATYDYVNSRSRLVRDVTMLADIVGTNSTAALTFKDATAAADTLRATAVNEHILDARLFTRDGTLLATYLRAGRRGAPICPSKTSRRPASTRSRSSRGTTCASCGRSFSTTRSSAASRWSPTRPKSGPGSRASRPSSRARCSGPSGLRSACRARPRG